MNDNFKEILNSALDLIQKKEGGMIFVGFEEETDKKRILTKFSEEFTRSKYDVYSFNISQILSEQNRDREKRTCMLKIVDEILQQDNIHNQIKENPHEGIKNHDKDGIQYRDVKIQWESEEREDAVKGEFNNIGVNAGSQPIETNIENMINTLKEQLVPLINKMPELFEKDIDKNEHPANEDITNNGDKIEPETGAEKKDSGSIVDNFNPLSLLEGLFKNLENMPDFSEPIIEDENLIVDPSNINNEFTEKSGKSPSYPNEIRGEGENDISEVLDPEEHSILISKIIDGLKMIPESSVLILDEIDCAEETTFDIFNEILLHSKNNIPLIIIGAYQIRKSNSPRGINNRYLRMLLTRFKIDDVGKTFIIKKT